MFFFYARTALQVLKICKTDKSYRLLLYLSFDEGKQKKDFFFIIVFQKLSIVKKSVIISASVHIHNVQTKGTHFKSMGKSVHKGRWLHLIRQLIALQGHFRNIYDILRQLNRDIHIVIVLLWV